MAKRNVLKNNYYFGFSYGYYYDTRIDSA